MVHQILLKYALNQENQYVFIDDVPNGYACNCLCPSCKQPLNARNGGTIKEHSFAHQPGSDCVKGVETVIHQLAKEIILEEKKIPLFDNENKPLEIQNVEVEKNLGDIQPDLYVTLDGHPIAIEIYVTHPVDDEKYKKIEQHRLTTIEVNLSNVTSTLKEEIKQELYKSENMTLIYNYEIMQGYINQKKNIILQNGKLQVPKSGIIQHCPMKIIQMGRSITMRSVKENECKNCFLSCYVPEEKGYCCLGYRNFSEPFPFWFLRANVNENRFMTIQETNDYFNKYTKGKINKVFTTTRR